MKGWDREGEKEGRKKDERNRRRLTVVAETGGSGKQKEEGRKE
jgi:hypothetical protein